MPPRSDTWMAGKVVKWSGINKVHKMLSCYSLWFIHRPPLHIVIESLYIFQPLPEYFCCIIHIVVSGCPVWEKVQYSSAVIQRKRGKSQRPQINWKENGQFRGEKMYVWKWHPSWSKLDNRFLNWEIRLKIIFVSLDP